jgi:hypothetical protein
MWKSLCGPILDTLDKKKFLSSHQILS